MEANTTKLKNSQTYHVSATPIKVQRVSVLFRFTQLQYFQFPDSLSLNFFCESWLQNEISHSAGHLASII